MNNSVFKRTKIKPACKILQSQMKIVRVDYEYEYIQLFLVDLKGRLLPGLLDHFW